jgi:hypothetical protein
MGLFGYFLIVCALSIGLAVALEIARIFERRANSMKQLLDHREELEAALGTAELEIDVKDECYAEVTTGAVRLSIGYDPRDRILSSFIAPLNMPDGLDEKLQAATLLQMIGFMDDDTELGSRHIQDLSEEIRIVGIVMREIFLGGPARIRDAHFFHAGHCAGYTDRMNDGPGSSDVPV